MIEQERIRGVGVTIDGEVIPPHRLFTVYRWSRIAKIRSVSNSGYHQTVELRAENEGVDWCRGWEGEAVQALEVAYVLR